MMIKMKITKSQLKQIIKEEIGETFNDEDEASDQMAADGAREVVELFSDLYNNLPDDKSKELFEHYLNKNVDLYTKRWQKERRDSRFSEYAASGGGFPLTDPELPEELS